MKIVEGDPFHSYLLQNKRNLSLEGNESVDRTFYVFKAVKEKKGQ